MRRRLFRLLRTVVLFYHRGRDAWVRSFIHFFFFLILADTSSPSLTCFRGRGAKQAPKRRSTLLPLRRSIT